MNGNYGHTEAAVGAIVLVGLLALLDSFVSVADGHPLKVPVYFGLFFVVYFLLRVYIRKQ